MNRKERRRKAATQQAGKRTPAFGSAALTRSQQPPEPTVLAATAPASAQTPKATAWPLDPVEVPLGWVRSALPQVVWPAIPDGIGAQALAIQFQFEQTQWWSPERLRAHQFAQLATLVKHAGATVPFYRDTFRRIGFDPNAPLDEESWSKLPYLTRSDIQEASAKLESEAIPASHGKTFKTGTSGSTATPISVRKTGLQQILWEAVTLRDHLWHRRDLAGCHASLTNVHGWAYPAGKRDPNWGGSEAPYQSGPACSLGITTSVEHQAEWLARMKPTYLNTFPSNLHALAQHCRDTGMTFPTLRGLRTNSEILRPETRELCRSVLGLEIADMYSSAEAGYMALQSPDSEELLIQAETILVEVFDDHGRPCAPGQVGRVIVTPLHAFAMPLLRYANGDRAEVGGPASCGRGLPTLRRVLGREREMITLPTGQRFWPSFLGLWDEFEAIRQFQLVRKTETLIEMRLVLRAPFGAAEEARFRQELQERLMYPFEIRFVYLDAIPREPSGKFFDFKSEVD